MGANLNVFFLPALIELQLGCNRPSLDSVSFPNPFEHRTYTNSKKCIIGGPKIMIVAMNEWLQHMHTGIHAPRLHKKMGVALTPV